MKTLDKIKDSLPEFDLDSQKIEHVSVRQVFCYLARIEGYQFAEIGQFIKHCHSTVIHSVNKVEVLISISDRRTLAILETFKTNNAPNEEIRKEQSESRVIDIQLRTEALFIQEVINDLCRRGMGHGKAFTMLRDWSRELKRKGQTTGKRKKLHAEIVGRYLY